MIVRPFNSNKDYFNLKNALTARDMSANLMGDLPSFGLVAYEGDQFIAAGFLRSMEGPYAVMDSYITNRHADPELRDKALDWITGKLIRIAESSNINKLLAFSADLNTIHRASRHGFMTAQTTVFQVRPLK